METYTQENRRLSVETPLGRDVLLLKRFAGQERLSSLFQFELHMVSTEKAIDPADIVGKNVTVGVMRPDESWRYFNGYVSRFAYRGRDDRFHVYYAEMVPWLWFLTRQADCRIFEQMTAQQIIEQVFSDRGFSDFSTAGIGSAPPQREYCVQYRESDFAFISRLLEEEGIFYFFRHENGKHTLVLADSAQAYEPIEHEKVQMRGHLGAPNATDTLDRWEHAFSFRTGRWSLSDRDPEAPLKPVVTATNTVVELDNVEKFEQFEYPGGYAQVSRGEALARIRMEAEEGHHEVVLGGSICRGFSAGVSFHIEAHPNDGEEGRGYVITAVQHEAEMTGAFVSRAAAPSLEYRNSFEAIPDSRTFRPPRSTPRPLIYGSQTALVTGPDGQEIHTDELGRVRVQFYWDRRSASGSQSCWVRVAQSLAGPRWGAVFLPRIGHEVVVSFLEGDPDRPVITGSVYNAAAMPPYELPENKTRSTVKTDSTPDAEGFNEIRFEDKAGDEQMFIHAQKDLDMRVKNDRRETVENDRHLTVENDAFEHVKGDRHQTVDGDQNQSIDGTLSVRTGSDVQIRADGKMGVDGGNEIHLKAATVVIEAMQGLTLKCGGSNVVLDPAGATIKGSMVTIDGSLIKIASGPGSPAGSGAGASPDSATLPDDADDAEGGQTVEPEQPEEPEVQAFSPAAAVLESAARDGTPFCEQCEEARRQQQSQGG